MNTGEMFQILHQNQLLYLYIKYKSKHPWSIRRLETYSLKSFLENCNSRAVHRFQGVLDYLIIASKIVSEYDQEIPQSQTADNPVAPLGRAAQPSRDTRNTN